MVAIYQVHPSPPDLMAHMVLASPRQDRQTDTVWWQSVPQLFLACLQPLATHEHKRIWGHSTPANLVLL